MMPAAQDDLAGEVEAAQNNEDATITSRLAGTRKPSSSCPQKEQKHPPSSSKKSEVAPPLQLTPSTVMADPDTSSSSREDYLAKYGDDRRRSDAPAASATTTTTSTTMQRQISYPSVAGKHVPVGDDDETADVPATNREAYLTKDRRRGPRTTNKAGGAAMVIIVEPAHRPGAVQVPSNDKDNDNDNTWAESSWSALIPPSDNDYLEEQLELELGKDKEEDLPDYTLEAELAPDLNEIKAEMEEGLKAEMEERMQQEIANRLERERELQVEIPVAEATEVKPYTEDHPPTSSSSDDRRKVCSVSQTSFFCVLGSIVFLVVVAGVVAGVVLATNDEDAAPTASPSISAPTTEPTAAPIFISVQLQALVASISPDNGEALKNTSSPQYQALTWLVSSGRNSNSSNTSYVGYAQKMAQRYVCAVLYYSTNGDGWAENNGWLSEDDECGWLTRAAGGIICDENNKIQSLVLYSNNLAGTIPPELSLLSNSLGTLLLLHNSFV
jgi:hypothetical protein